ncbi:MAG: alanine--tRNA ligase-related protein [Patescibacteria group bacterium]
MTHNEIRQNFLEFFEARNHKWVESSSLLPTDPSVLFTTAGMQQFKPYYTGQADAMKDFGSLNTASIQKSMRTSDIDEVGDETHLTFFEMLGNFSFGGYWKKEAIQYGYDFITKELGLKIDYVTIFGGEDIQKIFEFKKIKAEALLPDNDSENIWKDIDPNIRVEKRGIEDNFWGPTGEEGPCGPTTEIYVNGVEIWNIVFNEYYCTKDFKFKPLKNPGIDTGMGLERLAMVVQKKKNIFETDLFAPITSKLPNNLSERQKRIAADHLRASVFLIADGVRPSNKEQGYVLRRLMRRVLSFQVFHIDSVVDIYHNQYPELKNKKMEIISVYKKEQDKFARALYGGGKELEKLNKVDVKEAFRLYESFGLPYEVIKDVAGNKAENLTREAFDEEYKKHQEKSRSGAKKKFGGHGLLLETGELKATNPEELKKATRLHTATHLLHAALRKILGSEVKQAGSDITPERLRFDFSFPRKLTNEELKKIEYLANEVVEKDYKVLKEEMDYEDAIKSGALAFFKLKYPKRVDVYTIGDFSKELCGGPHVSRTGEIGKIKITKEEAVSAGIRRIRAILENGK